MTTLKEILAFNEQVVGLRRSGSSVNLGLPRSPEALESALNQITSKLSGRSAADRGQGSAAFEDRLLNSKSLPLPYQQTIEAGIREGRLPAAFEGIIESSRIKRASAWSTRFSFSDWHAA